MQRNKRVEYCRDLPSAARYWAEIVTRARQQAASMPGRVLDVRYERLVTNPRETMQRVLDFLGEPWDDAVLHHHEADLRLPDHESSSRTVALPITPDAKDRWKTELTDREKAQIEQACGPVLEALVYLDRDE